MNAALIKRLFVAIQSGSPATVDALCRRIAEDEKKRGHVKVAEDLGRILSAPAKKREQENFSAGLVPTSRRDSAPLVHVIAHSSLRHHMVLPSQVEQRFCRIEKEYAAKHRLAAHGLKPSRRILLYGPPGCGKSLGAERLAWATGLDLHRVRFDTLLSSYFGETLSNLRRLFDEGTRTPCALFLDECDSLARSRTERNDVGEVNRITNALLELLENHQGDGLVIAATNLDSSLDSALFRRFDEIVKVPVPSVREIARLLETTLSGIRVEHPMDWPTIASQLDGMSCSEVFQIAQTAAKQCVLNGGNIVTKAHLAQAAQEYAGRSHS